MRILLVGVLDVVWSTNCEMKRALEDLGHSVDPFNFRTVAREQSGSPPLGSKVLDEFFERVSSFLRSSRLPFTVPWYYRRRGRKQMNDSLLSVVRQGAYDLTIFSKTEQVDFTLLSRISRYCPTWFFFMDPMSQAIRMNAASYARRATFASATFTDVHELFRRQGANSFWITQGVDTEMFFPADAEKDSDIVFAGSRSPERARYVGALRAAGMQTRCFGEGWDEKPVYQADLVQVYRRAKIVLNLCREGEGFSVRVFQVMGAGAFVLSEYCGDLAGIFRKGQHLDWFNSCEELVNAARYWIRNEQERAVVARRGCGFVRENYSWVVVMKKIVEMVNDGALKPSQVTDNQKKGS